MIIYSPATYGYWINPNTDSHFSMKSEKKFKNYFFSFVDEKYIDSINFTFYSILEEPIIINNFIV